MPCVGARTREWLSKSRAIQLHLDHVPPMLALHRSVISTAAVLIGSWRAAAQVPAVPPQRTTAFVNVTVIPMDRERTLERQTVIVRDGRIAAIGPVSSTDVPGDALRIDGQGKFLLPGLAEMHGHVPGQPGPLANATMFLYVANGITTVRGMQGSPYHLTLREQIARGEVLGPRFYAAGPQMGQNIRTPAIGDSVARAQKAAGYDLLKIQEGMPLDAYDAVVAAARSVGIPFGGHVPNDVGLWHVIASRQGTIDHLDNYMDAVVAPDFPADELARVSGSVPNTPYARQIAAVAAATKRAGIAVVPTMPLWENLYISLDSASYAGRAELRYMPRTTVASWFRTITNGGRVFGDSARRAWRAMRMDILRALAGAQVPILLGTDSPQLFSVPGFSIHREMQSMAEVGMTPYKILLTGTRNVAAHFGTLSEAGTVEVGKRADLLLLDANPMAAVANVQRRAGVMVNGRWLPESEIQRGLEALAVGYAAPSMPQLHHVGLNSVDPDRAIEWYLRAWPTAKRTTVAGYPAVEGDMLLLFNKVAQPAPGAWRDDLHRAEPQSAFWHIGANTNTTGMDARLKAIGVSHLPLYLGPKDARTVWRSGLAPYNGTLTAGQLDTAAAAPPRDGGFSYVVAPDGVLFEFTGGPGTRDGFSHIHFFHEQPLCAANWYVEQLGMALPAVRGATGADTVHKPWDPCEMKYGEAGWPSLEPVGTIRQPAGNVRFGNGSMSWYPRQCVGNRCGRDQPLVRSRGQALDHVAFTVDDFDALLTRLRRAGVKVLEEPHAFGDTRAFMIEDPDGLAIELVERRGSAGGGRS